MNLNLRNITNYYLDAKLISLSTWAAAKEFTPRDRNGPYVVLQEGYDPEDSKFVADEFILGRSGKWLSLGHFYQMPVDARRAEFVFGTAAEVIQLMSNLPSKVQLLRPSGKGADAPPAAPANDEMAIALNAGKSGKTAAPGTT